MSNQMPHHIMNLVSTALSQNKLSIISGMLESLAKAVNAYGCILWQVVPGSKLDPVDPSGYLFVLAEWFPNKKTDPLHDLPLEDSITGAAVLSGKLINIHNYHEDTYKGQKPYTKDPFIEETGIRSFCSVPLKFLDGRHGALNLYRTELVPFSPQEEEQIKQLASLVPALYKAIRDRVNFTVIRNINKILNQAERKASKEKEPPSKEQVKKDIQRICDLVTNTFQCIETSIFLEDRLTRPGVYELMATTWSDFIVKDVYTKSEKDGITGWILTHSTAVTIFDLAHYERDKELIQKDYPGLSWDDNLDIKNAVRRVRGLEEHEALPPLSFMGVPITMGKEVLGAIRCSVAKEGPYYFSDLAKEILRLVAALISRYWRNWIGQCEKQEDIRSWEALLKSVREMNRFVHTELTKESPNEHRIFTKTLEVTSEVIRGAEIIDVRLPREGELYFAATHGAYWNEGNRQAIEKRKHHTFSLDEKSAGSLVFKTGRVHIMSDVSKDEYYKGHFDGIKRMIVAPIRVADRKFGVLDIRGTGEVDFPPHAEAVAEFLGQQLGLFQYLANTVGKLRETQTDLTKKIAEQTLLEEQQTQIFVDLKHQIYSPINLASARLQMFKREFPDAAASATMLKIRGLFGKTRRIAMNLALIENLAREKPIEVDLVRLRTEELINMLLGSALNSQLMMRSKFQVEFEIDRPTFDVLETHEVSVDKNLLEHAIMNLMDNAFKYSYPKHTVDISGGSSKAWFYISIKNVGIPISERDAKQCVERGFRSADARKVTGEGSGIGLWIVDHIMKAHQGMLQIIPRSKQTDVRLFFPLLRK